ncbi:uncharacterized protein LOC132722231 [Ruditapes philippinarum]|uniref:uncharacterized protein LOC132722231 n=1 Tax=Ruditapes philippinarum TaxID=129788 RepID=UPI00295B56AC|nr:uncharacterized protein LOC132722231 [Ruditapes philippinarum]
MPISVINIFPCKGKENSENIADDGFEIDMKYFLWCLKFTGLHQRCWSGTKERLLFRRLSNIYRGFVPVLLIFNFIFSLGEFINVKGFDGALLNSLISSIWFMQVALFSLNNAIRAWRWQRFYKRWNEYENEYKTDSKRFNRKLSILVVICYIFWVLIAAAFMGVGMSSPRPPSGFILYVPEELVLPITIFIIVAYFFFISTWFLLTSQFAIICITICRLLQELYKTIKSYFENPEKFSEDIESFRQRHDKICVMILRADDILSTFIMTTVASTIPIIVLTLYFVIFVTDGVHTFSYAATWWSISLSTLQLTVVFLLGGAVNFMLNVFLNRLTSQPIGLTACGLFVLDKPTIVTFVGSIATYAIVMIQFKPGEGSYNVVCNCTV